MDTFSQNDKPFETPAACLSRSGKVYYLLTDVNPKPIWLFENETHFAWSKLLSSRVLGELSDVVRFGWSSPPRTTLQGDSEDYQYAKLFTKLNVTELNFTPRRRNWKRV